MEKINKSILEGFKVLGEKINEIEERLDTNGDVSADVSFKDELRGKIDKFLGMQRDGQERGLSINATPLFKRKSLTLWSGANSYQAGYVPPSSAFSTPYHTYNYIQNTYPNIKRLEFRRYITNIAQNSSIYAQEVSEGSTKPEANYQLYNVNLAAKKVAVRISVTDEQIKFGGFADYVENLLNRDLNFALHNNILSDILLFMPVFNAFTYNNSVPQANLYDLIGVMTDQYLTTYAYGSINGGAGLDYWVLPESELIKLKYIKDTTGNYVSGVGLTNFINNPNKYIGVSLPSNEAYGINSSQVILYIDTDITMRRGYATGDFESNKETFIFEVYYLALPVAVPSGIYSSDVSNDIATINI